MVLKKAKTTQRGPKIRCVFSNKSFTKFTLGFYKVTRVMKIWALQFLPGKLFSLKCPPSIFQCSRSKNTFYLFGFCRNETFLKAMYFERKKYFSYHSVFFSLFQIKKKTRLCISSPKSAIFWGSEIYENFIEPSPERFDESFLVLSGAPTCDVFVLLYFVSLEKFSNSFDSALALFFNDFGRKLVLAKEKPTLW